MENTDEKLMTVKEMAKELGKQKKAVQYQLDKYNIKQVKTDKKTQARLYNKDTFQFLAQKMIDNRKQQSKITDEIKEKGVEPATAMALMAKIDTLISDLDDETVTTALDHVESLINQNQAEAANEYLRPLLNRQLEYIGKINDLTAKIDNQTRLIKAQTQTIENLNSSITQLQKQAKDAKNQFKKLSWVDTQKVISESWEKLTAEQQKHYMQVLPLGPTGKFTAENTAENAVEK